MADRFSIPSYATENRREIKFDATKNKLFLDILKLRACLHNLFESNANRKGSLGELRLNL